MGRDEGLFGAGSAWNLKRQLVADPILETEIAESPDAFDAFLRKLEIEDSIRNGEVLRDAIATAFGLSKTGARHWGFKEIWNGSAALHDWSTYDHVFPQAVWVHIVRHPAAFARAVLWHAGQPPSRDDWRQQLDNWMNVVATSRARAVTGRFYEVKYEDLTGQAQEALAPLFSGIGIRWHDDCRLAQERQWGRKSAPLSSPEELPFLIGGIPGLRETMGEMGYEVEVPVVPVNRVPAPLPPCLETRQGGQWRLGGQISREEGNCWLFDLSRSDFAGEFAAVADDVERWRRSPLRLFEDGRPLVPPHALHFRIRTIGKGAYSHWRNELLFSTSDNSDPNENDRAYTFTLGEG